MTRRGALAGTVLALGTAFAQQQITQGDASYQPIPKGDQHSAGCFNSAQPNACKFVQGAISPNGWCQLYASKTG